MASKKTTKPAAKKAPASKPAAKTTAVRHSAIPKIEAAAPAIAAPTMEITGEMIARRAYEIWCGNGGSETDNWFRAEAELRAA